MLCRLLLLVAVLSLAACEQKKAKKDIRDFNDADLERLYEQWEEDDDPLEEDELPPWKRPAPPLDLSQLDTKNPESILQASKKGKSLMMFATVSGTPDKRELEDITGIWESSLFNAHMETNRFVIDERRVIFMFQDGSKAWDAMKFLVTQDRCEEVTIEGKSYPGKGAPKTDL